MKCIYCGKEIATGSMCEECSKKNNSLNLLDNSVAVNNTDNHNKEKGTPFFREEAKYPLSMYLASLLFCYTVSIFTASSASYLPLIIFSIIDFIFAFIVATRRNKYEIFYFVLFVFMFSYFPIINFLYLISHSAYSNISSTGLLPQILEIDSALHLSVFLGIGLGLLISPKSNTINTNKVYYCEYCGSPLDNLEYCSKCGSKVTYKIPENNINTQNEKGNSKLHKILTYLNNNFAFPLILFITVAYSLPLVCNALFNGIVFEVLEEPSIAYTSSIFSYGSLLAIFVIDIIFAYYIGRYASKSGLIFYIILNILISPYAKMFLIYSNNFIEQLYLFNESFIHIEIIIGILLGIAFKKFGKHSNSMERITKKEAITNLLPLIIPVIIIIISYAYQINYFNTTNDVIPDNYIVAFHSFENEKGISHSTYIYDAGNNYYTYINTRNTKHIVNGKEEKNKMILSRGESENSSPPCNTQAIWNGANDYFVLQDSSIKYPLNSFENFFHYFEEEEE